MKRIFLRLWWWSLGLLAFFSVFAFALNNRAVVTIHWFFGYASHIQLVLLVLLTLMLGVFLGALAVLPLWWKQYRYGRQKSKAEYFSESVPHGSLTAGAVVSPVPRAGKQEEVIDAV